MGHEVCDIKNGVGSRDSNPVLLERQDYISDVQTLARFRLFKEKRRPKNAPSRQCIPKFQKKLESLGTPPL